MTAKENSIFHFTSSIDMLKAILNSLAFKVSYCKEQMEYSLGNESGGSLKYEYAVPMVSFCDVPLVFASNSKTAYGQFGIGLRLAWATRNKMNPVLYIDKQSNISTGMYRILSQQSGSKDLKTNEATTWLIQLMKNREGKIDRNGVLQSITFYSEREWRFNPKIDGPDKERYPAYIYSSDYAAKLTPLGSKPHLNEDKYLLKFDLDDINVIVVEKNKDVSSIYNLFADVNDRLKVAAKTVSIEQLRMNS